MATQQGGGSKGAEQKKDRKPRATTQTPQKVLGEAVKKLNSNQCEYLRFHLKNYFGQDYAGTSEFEKDLHNAIKAVFTS